MCKYCQLKTLNEGIGEKTNNCISIGKLMDGSQIFNLYLNRYIIEADDIHRNFLELELEVGYGNSVISLGNKNIKIKYCPFCGKEL